MLITLRFCFVCKPNKYIDILYLKCYNCNSQVKYYKGVKMKNIDKQIRLEGEILKLISPLGSEKVQRIMGPISTKALSVLKLKGLNCKKIKINRPDGTSFRACVMRGKKRRAKLSAFFGFTAAAILLVHLKWQL